MQLGGQTIEICRDARALRLEQRTLVRRVGDFTVGTERLDIPHTRAAQIPIDLVDDARERVQLRQEILVLVSERLVQSPYGIAPCPLSIRRDMQPLDGVWPRVVTERAPRAPTILTPLQAHGQSYNERCRIAH